VLYLLVSEDWDVYMVGNGVSHIPQGVISVCSQTVGEDGRLSISVLFLSSGV
jgi:hypothetical protein